MPSNTQKNDKAAQAKAAQAARIAERNAAETLHRTFDAGRSSVPVKSLASFKAYKPALGALRCNTPSARQAAALTIAILASDKTVSDGVSFKRKFSHSGGSFAIENGCAADCVSVGLATYNAKTETFKLSTGAAATIAGLLGNYDEKLPALAGLKA